MRLGLKVGMGCVLGLCVASAGQAADGRRVAVTVYSSGLALVEDTRPITFSQGRSAISFPDVSARIRAETASLAATGITVIEQNFDFDLLTPQKLMEKALGQKVRIVRTNPGTGAQIDEEAVILSTQAGVVLGVGGKVEVLRDDGIPTRVIFDKVPENLRARPTLSVLAASNQAGERPATLSYMTDGIRARVDYVAVYDERAKALDLQGWVTLTNETSVAYPNAKVRVANLGGRNRDSEGGSAFTLPEPVTISDRQAKQVSLADLRGISAEKVYRSVWAPGRGFFSGTGDTEKADVVLRFSAKDGAGQERALPAGALRGFVRDAKGDAQFIGETHMSDIPPGAKVETKISRAFDIDVTPRLVKDERFGQNGARFTLEFKVANASESSAPVEIELGGLGPDVRTLSESVKGTALDAYRRQWVVTVPAKGEAILTAVIERGK